MRIKAIAMKFITAMRQTPGNRCGCLRVPGESTGIKQRVYLPVHRTLDYEGSFYARHLGGQTGVIVALRMRDQDEVLTSQQIDVADESWKKFTFTLHVPEGKAASTRPRGFCRPANR